MRVYEQNLGPFAMSEARPSSKPAGRGWIARCLDAIALWHERARSRRSLLTMSDYMLQDIGHDRSIAVREAAKPFWR
jgi:uncharacterized protein YjiS (DUF1127 family)